MISSAIYAATHHAHLVICEVLFQRSIIALILSSSASYRRNPPISKNYLTEKVLISLKEFSVMNMMLRQMFFPLKTLHKKEETNSQELERLEISIMAEKYWEMRFGATIVSTLRWAGYYCGRIFSVARLGARLIKHLKWRINLLAIIISLLLDARWRS